jgi:small-conductance mechanosensitive channel
MKKALLLLIATNLFAADILNETLVRFDNVNISIFVIVKFFILLTIGFAIGWIYRYKIISSDVISSKLTPATKTLLINLGYYFIIFLTIVTSFNSIGLNLSSLTVVAGALSVGIGFGLQNIVSNFISGIILMFEKSIEVGHMIILSDGTRGTVKDIKLRATIVTTPENADMIIPNSNFIQNSVTNLTLENEIIKIKVPFGVAYGTDIDMVEKLILSAIDDESLPHIKGDDTKVASVYFVSMGASSLDFELVIWVDGLDARKRAKTISKYLTIIYNILNKHDINIPFPQLDLHIKETPTPLSKDV